MKKLIGIAGIMVLSGCISNSYKISTNYASPADNLEVKSEIEGKATPGRIAFLYKSVLEFVSKNYQKAK